MRSKNPQFYHSDSKFVLILVFITCYLVLQDLYINNTEWSDEIVAKIMMMAIISCKKFSVERNFFC